MERATKLVVEARLKGSGMHWAPAQVNPLLALRNAWCRDRGAVRWQERTSTRAASRRARRADRQTDTAAAAVAPAAAASVELAASPVSSATVGIPVADAPHRRKTMSHTLVSFRGHHAMQQKRSRNGSADRYGGSVRRQV
ncbi:MAG: hypothetical protein ACYDCQ_00900 [Dehalococcoidia bacterium]